MAITVSACASEGYQGPVDWGLANQEGKSVILSVTSFKPDCMKSQHVVVNEDVDTVEILVVREGYPATRSALWGGEVSTRFCTLELSYDGLLVELDAPLGDRVLIGCDMEERERDVRFFGERASCNDIAPGLLGNGPLPGP